jgi:hypothetical protein
MTDSSAGQLDEYDKEEWRAVARRLRPDWTDEQFEEAWIEFVEMKKRKKMQ